MLNQLPTEVGMILICTASHGENLKLATRVEEALNQKGCETCLVDLTAIDLPLYTSRTTARPNEAVVGALVSAFSRAKGFFFTAPEYNGSIPPTLTNAIAWLSTESDDFRSFFNNKPAVIATHSGGGGQKLLASLRIHLSHLGVNVLGRELAGNGRNEVRESSLNDALTRLCTYADAELS